MKHFLSYLFISLWGVCALWSYLYPLFQKRQPLPLSPQNYPLHSSEVNGFHSAPTTYNHPPAAINGEGIMGEGNLFLKWTYHASILVASVSWSFDCFFFLFYKKQINGSSDSHYLFCLCSQPRHHSWQFRRWNWEGSCLSEFLFIIGFSKLVLGNGTITVILFYFLWSENMWCWVVCVSEGRTNKCKFN